MYRGRKTLALILAALMLLSGCIHMPDQPATTGTAQSTQAVPPTDDGAEASLVAFRQSLVETPQRFAVAYLGSGQQDPTDPFALMQESVPLLCENLPFLLQISNVVGSSGQLYCIVPADENATVAVNGIVWGQESYDYSDVLYRSEKGDPILLLCNSSTYGPDVQVTITDSDGTVTLWWPELDSSLRISPMTDENGESVFRDFSHYDELPAPKQVGGSETDLAGTWVLTCTEVEGDRVEVSSGKCTLEITASMMATYRDNEFPKDNFVDRDLTVVSGEMYPDCGNNQWIAYISTEAGDRITHTLTLLEDGTLLMQHRWKVDGMPMVGYSWFRRAS